MALYWFQCKKCTTLIKQDRVPSSLGCPSGHSHDWKKLGEFGDTNYLCKKCGTLIQAKANPSSLGCPSGHSHDWKKM